MTTPTPDPKWVLWFRGDTKPMIPGPFATKADAEAWQARYGIPTLTPYIDAVELDAERHRAEAGHA